MSKEIFSATVSALPPCYVRRTAKGNFSPAAKRYHEAQNAFADAVRGSRTASAARLCGARGMQLYDCTLDHWLSTRDWDAVCLEVTATFFVRRTKAGHMPRAGDVDNRGKALLDCLVRNFPLPDDSPRYVRGVTYRYCETKRDEFTSVSISEVPQ